MVHHTRTPAAFAFVCGPSRGGWVPVRPLAGPVQCGFCHEWAPSGDGFLLAWCLTREEWRDAIIAHDLFSVEMAGGRVRACPACAARAIRWEPPQWPAI